MRAHNEHVLRTLAGLSLFSGSLDKKKARIDSQFLTENHPVWGTLTDTGTDFCVYTWLRTVTACLNVVAKRDGAALPRLPSFSPVWCQLACRSISRVKYKKANHINVTSKYLQVPAKKCPHFYSNRLASGIGKKRHNVCAFFYFPQEDTFVTGCLMNHTLYILVIGLSHCVCPQNY